MKKIICLSMSVIMFLSVMFGVNVSVFANNISLATLTPIKPYEISEEKIDYTGKGWYCDPPQFIDGDVITFYYNDDSTEQYVFKDNTFKNSSGEVLNVFADVPEPALPGETTTFKVILTDFNISIDVPLKIVKKSPSSTVDGIISKPMQDENKKDNEQKSETTPSLPATPSTSKKPATVVASKPQSKQKAVVVTWKPAKDVDGYEIQVATDKKFKKNKKSAIINKKNTKKKTIKNLKKNKKYFVRVRAYKIVDGKKSYGKWSKIKSVKTK